MTSEASAPLGSGVFLSPSLVLSRTCPVSRRHHPRARTCPRGELHMRLKLLLVVLLCLCAIPTYAQFKASIQGTIMDSGGGAVGGATVRIAEQDTGANRDTVSSDEGFYRIA